MIQVSPPPKRGRCPRFHAPPVHDSSLEEGMRTFVLDLRVQTGLGELLETPRRKQRRQ